LQCNVCGNETVEATGVCPDCASNLNKVQVLPPDERESFHGLTIEQDGRRETNDQTESPFRKVFVYNSASAGTMTKLILNAILLCVVILFLPLALFLAATLGLNWLSNRSRQ
jgi:hypothetical protein